MATTCWLESTATRSSSGQCACTQIDRAAHLLAPRAATATARTARAEWEAARPQRWTPGDGRPIPLNATETAVDLVRTRGVGWLVEQAITDGVTVAPLVVLSARYATHADAGTTVAWAHRAQPLPLHTAVDLALADDERPAAAGAALLALLPDLRAEWGRTEAAITAAARRAGLPEPAPR